ncbi:hypothetical protein [Novacetimonas hansenii]|uniref:hypothetical protein n=1 Tax=Novacetimonas hansenii TaxID=436 RepID=UPI00111518BC|nr:hypothetical protein [Novacetimonas hansenii]
MVVPSTARGAVESIPILPPTGAHGARAAACWCGSLGFARYLRHGATRIADGRGAQGLRRHRHVATPPHGPVGDAR